MTKRVYKTKAVRLSSEIQAKIANGGYPVGAMLPPEVELGGTHDASRVTIRRALDMLAEKGIVERIPHRGVIVKTPPGGAVSSNSARAMSRVTRRAPPVRTTRALRFGTVLATRPDEGLVQIQEGIEEFVRQHELSLQLISSWEGSNVPLDAINEVEMLGIDGLIVLPYAGGDHFEILAEMRTRGVPVVCIEKRQERIDHPSVEQDNATGMYRAVNYLIQTYKQPVWFLGMGLDHKSELDRYDGYVRAMRDAGFSERVESHTVLHGIGSSDPNYWREERKWLHGYELGVRLLDLAKPPLSVACIKDDIAWGVYNAARERGVRIGREPGDLHVTGFDNMTISQLLDPPLTTVSQPMKDKGYQAAQLLFGHITRGRQNATTVRLPVQLLVRGSA